MKTFLVFGGVFLLLFGTVLTIVPKNANADVLYAENFEDGVANGVSGGYLVSENGNTFYRSWTGSSSNVPMYTTQTFQDGMVLEYSTRNDGRYDIGVYLINPSWQVRVWSDIGYYSPYPVLGLQTYWSGQETTPVYESFPLAYQWYDVKVALVGGVTKLYVDGVLIDEYDVGAHIPPVLTGNFYFTWLTWGKRDIDNIRVSAVPEPTTMFLLGSGLIGLAGYGRKKFFKK